MKSDQIRLSKSRQVHRKTQVSRRKLQNQNQLKHEIKGDQKGFQRTDELFGELNQAGQTTQYAYSQPQYQKSNSHPSKTK